MELAAVLLGFVIGCLAGLTGMGGGSLMTPLLILALGTPPVTAVGTDLAYMGVTKLFGALQHYRRGGVSTKMAKPLILGGAPAALAGSILLSFFRLGLGPAANDALKAVLSAMLVVTGLTIAHQSISRRSSASPPRGSTSPHPRSTAPFLLLSGMAIGFLVSITSVGSGALLIPLLVLYLKLPVKKLVGTDLFFAAIITASSSIVYAFARSVDLALLLPLLAGSIPGVALGSRLNDRAPERVLSLIIASSIFAVALALILK